MRRGQWGLVLVGTLVAAAAVVHLAPAGAAPKGVAPKVNICHRTNSATNPYRPIEVSQNAVDGVGGGDHFGEHQGPLVTTQAQAQALKDAKIEWGDIIPPVAGIHGGANWPAGQAILENNCALLVPPTTTTPVSTTTPPPTTQPSGGKVTICHRTNSATNPYNKITVDESAVDGVGGGDHFGEHQGPLVTSLAVAQAFKNAGVEWGDIIPPLPGVHGGLNWPAGQTILENNCEFVTPPPSTTTPPPTTEPTSTTRAPTSTTRAPSSTTKPPPPTTGAPTSTTKPPAPPTTVPPTTRPPTSTTVPPTTTTRAPLVVTPVPPKPSAPLAITGSNTARVAAVAMVMLVAGLILVMRTRRPPQLLTIGTSASTTPRTLVREPEAGSSEPADAALAERSSDSVDSASPGSLSEMVENAIDAMDAWVETIRRRRDN